MINLFISEKECCGCSACLNICPKNAINMVKNINGFIYPQIDFIACIECGLCNKVCSFQNNPVEKKEPIQAYAAINKNKEKLLLSSSGGIFSALSSYVFEKNGVVFGCAYDEMMEPKHIWVDDDKDLFKIQGSKYVQSKIGETYKDVKIFLESERYVLFTGTPCQIAGLKSFLGKEYANLITADIICHGVPSAYFFSGYIDYLESNLNGRIIDLKFRDKSRGWGHFEKIIYLKDGKIKKKLIHSIDSYYHTYFMEGDTLRENCYKCKYACISREGDFTMGDFWGIDKIHPEIKYDQGVSLFFVNSNKGESHINGLIKYLDLTKSNYIEAMEYNGTLKIPTKKSSKRKMLLKLWRDGGYNAVADLYYCENKNKIRRSKIKRLVPNKLKKLISKLMN